MQSQWRHLTERAGSGYGRTSTEIKFYKKTDLYESYKDYEFSIASFSSGIKIISIICSQKVYIDHKSYFGTDELGQIFFITYRHVKDTVYMIIRSAVVKNC
jgi:hypothetical protein